MRSGHLMKLSAAAAVAATLAGAALAQGGPGRMMGERAGGWGTGMWGNDGPGMGMGMGMWGRGPWSRGGPDWMLDRIEGRLAFLKAELKITESQTAAWNQLADAIRTAAKHHNERMKSVFSGDQKSKSLPERVVLAALNDQKAMGESAAELLRWRLDHPEGPVQRRAIRCNLKER